MALVHISIQDEPDGQVAVRLTTEPPVMVGQAAETNAQKLGAIALNALHESLAKASTTKGPRLVIVGADGMPH